MVAAVRRGEPSWLPVAVLQSSGVCVCLCVVGKVGSDTACKEFNNVNGRCEVVT